MSEGREQYVRHRKMLSKGRGEGCSVDERGAFTDTQFHSEILGEDLEADLREIERLEREGGKQ